MVAPCLRSRGPPLPGRDPVTVLGALATLTRVARTILLAEERQGAGWAVGRGRIVARAGRVTRWCPTVGGELTGFAAASHLARSGTSE